MKIAAITKFKQGELWEALQKAEWSQAELARQTGICTPTIGNYINLKTRPGEKNILKIQNAFAKKGIYIDILSIWPEDFKGIDRQLVVTQVREVPISHLIEDKTLLIEDHSSVIDDLISKEKSDHLPEALKSLSSREMEIVKLRYGLDGNDKHSLSKIGKTFNITRERVRQLENTGITRLQKWYNAKNLREV